VADDTDGSRSRRQTWLDAASKLTGLAGAAGLIVYSISYWEATRFYDQFHIDPAEVGLGQGTLILQSAVKLLTGALLLLTIGSLVALTALVAGRVLSRHRQGPGSQKHVRKHHLRHLIERDWTTRGLFSGASIFSAVFVTAWLVVSFWAPAYGRDVRAHVSTNPPQPYPLRLFLDVQTFPVSVAWTGQSPPGVSMDDPFLLLGSNNGIIVLFDGARGGTTLRVPVGSVDISSW
jgi:hypothetical protein